MIGQNFKPELDAAGITDYRFAWAADGSISFHPDVSQSEVDKVLAVLAAHDPAKQDRGAILESLRVAALAALAMRDLTLEALNPAAPQEVKDWKAERDRP